MNKKTTGFRGVITLVIICGVILTAGTFQGAYQEHRKDRPKIPFEFQEFGAPGVAGRWFARFLIRPEHFTINNLEEIFLWYSRQHPDKKETFMLYLYTDQKSYKQPDAVFAKFVAYCGRNDYGNLSYYYIPDLNHTEKVVSRILRGTVFGIESEFFEKIERNNESFRVETSSAMLNERVSPRGTYYTFWGSLASSDYRHGRHLFSLRLDKTIPIPANQIVFINDTTGYVYMGWLFSVTVDSGKTWHQWDAEIEFPEWKCCDPGLIQKVEITPEGSGTMTLQMTGKQLLLQTKDHGQHWTKFKDS